MHRASIDTTVFKDIAFQAVGVANVVTLLALACL